MDYEEILLECETRMEETLESLDKRFINVRAGRANASMLDGIMVEYYGAPTPLKQLANISVPEARQLSIKPFDKGILGDIEKAIFEANIGLTPNNNGEVIFLVNIYNAYSVKALLLLLFCFLLSFSPFPKITSEDLFNYKTFSKYIS